MDGPDRDSIIRLQTHLSPEECWARLDTVAGMYRCFFPWRFILGSKPLLGHRRGEHLVLAAKWPYKMPYPFWFYGRIVADGKGALIEGKFSLPREQRVILAVAFVVWAAVIAAVLLSQGAVGKPKILGVLFLMLLISAALYKYNQWYARRLHNTVLPLLQATLETTEV